MNYMENSMFMPEELGSWGFDEMVFSYYDSSSPEGVLSPLAASKSVVSERNRRRKLNDRLFALRAVVPNITKMDKASIIKDAIDRIQELREQERRIETEIYKLESGKSKKKMTRYEFEQELPFLHTPKRNKTEQFSYDSPGTRTSPIEVLDLSVMYMGERTIVVSLTCCKRADSMVKLCKVFESLKLKIITANITAVSGRLLKTVFIERRKIDHRRGGSMREPFSDKLFNQIRAEQEERDLLKIKIETALAGLNDPQSPMSI